MVKSIFVSAANPAGIEKSGANHLIIASQDVDQNNWKKLQSLGMTLAISINAFDHGGCPANPQAKEQLFERVNFALSFQPAEIWLDHFRFDGHWEGTRANKIAGIHPACQYCQGKNRVEMLAELAKEVTDRVNSKTQIGYFAVPFKDNEMPELTKELGHDHNVLGKIFDMSSPMLYHRMIGKPVTYISEYVKYLADTTQKPVLPIIQIKDMPDDLEDKMNEEDIAAAFNEAIKDPSIGVCFFWWEHALEKGKTGIISHLLSRQF